MSKRTVRLKLEEDEAAVVAPLEFWDHLKMVYRSCAEDAAVDDKAWWQHAEQFVVAWVEDTRNKVEPFD